MITRQSKIIRIAITGPESTGKSTLARQLAMHYSTTWVPEFARGYLHHLKEPYSAEDLIEIAKGQIASEDAKIAEANKLLFCDTELTVIKIWSTYKYGFVDPFILNEDNKRRYDLYLLMDIDLPWEYDPQREHPGKRQYFYEWFKNELGSKKANYQIICGNKNERFKNACQIIDRFL